MPNNTICFGDGDDTYGAFANAAPYAIRLEGVTWPTVTHYLTVQRYPELNWSLVRGCPGIHDLRCLVLERAPLERMRWDAWHDDYLARALAAKFTQHLDLEEQLIGTGTAELVYLCESDRHLGRAAHGYGRNMLGRLLVRVRDRLAHFKNAEAWSCVNEAEENARRKDAGAWELAHLAWCYLKVGLTDRALATARCATNLWPESEFAWRMLAAALIERSEFEAAIPALKTLVRLDPEDTDYLDALAQVCAMSDRDVASRVYARRSRLLKEADQSGDGDSA
jgi:hypothetical protein